MKQQKTDLACIRVYSQIMCTQSGHTIGTSGIFSCFWLFLGQIPKHTSGEEATTDSNRLLKKVGLQSATGKKLATL